MGRLTIDLTDQQHRDLKAIAALQGKTIKQFAVERLFATEGTVESDSDAAWEEFKSFIGKRVDEALAGNFSDMTAEEIFNEELLRDEAA
jgi:hypothetical protein